MNPYESSSSTSVGDRASLLVRTRSIGLIVVAVLFIVASLLGLIGVLIPAVRSATMPRFGWIGLILCLGPLNSLLLCLRRPTRNLLLSATLSTLALSAINSAQLIFRGTVSVVANEFHDRLHSSWLWSVISFVVIGTYLGAAAMTLPRESTDSVTKENK